MEIPKLKEVLGEVTHIRQSVQGIPVLFARVKKLEEDLKVVLEDAEAVHAAVEVVKGNAPEKEDGSD